MGFMGMYFYFTMDIQHLDSSDNSLQNMTTLAHSELSSVMLEWTATLYLLYY